MQCNEFDQYFGYCVSLGQWYLKCVSRKMLVPLATFNVSGRTLLYSEIVKYNFDDFNCVFFLIFYSVFGQNRLWFDFQFTSLIL